MTILKAVERLKWRFGSGNTFAPNKGDREALNAIIDFVNNSQDNVETNQGFAKLYVWAFAELCRRYDADVVDDIPQKQLHKLLEQPLEYFFKKFTEHLNFREKEKFIESIGIVGRSSFLCDDDEKERRAKKLAESLKNPENLKAFTGKQWEETEVGGMMMAQISFAITRYKL